MDEKDKRISELTARIEQLLRLHQRMDNEIRSVHKELSEMRAKEARPIDTPLVPAEVPLIEEVKKEKVEKPVESPSMVKEPSSMKGPVEKIKTFESTAIPKKETKENSPLEDFIGTNLLNKVGIAILVIGIGFGAKYAIDHQLLQPLTRIILGYVSGVILISVALRLKLNYTNFSAVLLSGGMAVLYFITYAAYDFYGLIPQLVAFALMVVFTIFTVIAALNYNLQVIAIIGLVGAYAVPFLLSDGSGRVAILFSYMTLINIGILVISFKKLWRLLNHLAFIFSWLIYSSWYLFDFRSSEHFVIGLVFASIFYLIFYISFLSYKVIRKEHLTRWDVMFMLLNSFIYFGIGYDTIDSRQDGSSYLGLFTVSIALVHFISALLVRKKNSASDTFYFVAGLVLIFLTLAVPVQLDGNWVTIVWAGEACLLFWIGRTKGFPIYEKLSYPLIFLAFISLLEDWSSSYSNYYIYLDEVPTKFVLVFLNVQFFTTLFVVASYAVIFWLSRKSEFPKPYGDRSLSYNAMNYVLPLTALAVLYLGIFKEIQYYWDQRVAASLTKAAYDDSGETYNVYNYDLPHFKTIWLIIYSAVFGLALSVFNQQKMKTREFTFLCMIFNYFVIAGFLAGGLFALTQLRESYLSESVDNYRHGIYNLIIRYIALLPLAGLLWMNYRLIRSEWFTMKFIQGERVAFHVVVLILISSELLHWTDMAILSDQHSLSLTILWGCYALYLILVGLTKNRAHLRILAIVVFAVTIAKLFLYDMAAMSTISKTVVMIVLGALMLIASFLYNKSKKTQKS